MTTARRKPQTEAEQQLLDYLHMWQQLRQKMPRPAGFVYSSREDFLLQHGEFFEPRALPHGFQRGEAKACFNNALMHNALTRDAYVEGAALAEIRDGLSFPTEHAWNVTRGGLVIDTTWNHGIAYFGVRFPYRTALRAIAEGCTCARQLSRPLSDLSQAVQKENSQQMLTDNDKQWITEQLREVETRLLTAFYELASPELREEREAIIGRKGRRLWWE